MVLWPLTIVEWLAGRWQSALERATAAYQLTHQTQYAHALLWVGRAKTLVEVDLGLIEDARASAEESLAFSRATSNELGVIATTGAVGRLELLLGNLDAADGYLRDLPTRLLAGGLNDPTLTVWADTIEMLVARGELDQARVYLEAYEGHAEHFGSPWALTSADRCRGLLATARRRPDESICSL